MLQNHLNSVSMRHALGKKVKKCGNASPPIGLVKQIALWRSVLFAAYLIWYNRYKVVVNIFIIRRGRYGEKHCKA